MNKSKRLLLLLSASAIVSSCVTITPDVTQASDVGQYDGLLLARFHADDAKGTLAIHQGVASFPYAGFSIGSKDELKLIRIRAGDGLRFSTFKVGDKIAYFDNRKLNFSIKPRTITYIGDVHILQRPNTVYLRIEDSEEETKRLAMRRFPSFFSSFDYAKKIAGQP